jgi:hypothetical protein
LKHRKNIKGKLNDPFFLYKPNFDIPYLTVQQVDNACSKHKYLLLRFWAGNIMGINGKIARLALKRKKVKGYDVTRFVSFKPCGIQEYIKYKYQFC